MGGLLGGGVGLALRASSNCSAEEWVCAFHGAAVIVGSHYHPGWTPGALIVTPVAQLAVPAALERRGR